MIVSQDTDPRWLTTIGAPKSINSMPFELPKCFSVEELRSGKVLTKTAQIENMDIAVNDSPGWVGIVTSTTLAMSQLFALRLAWRRFKASKQRTEWHAITGARFDYNRLPEKKAFQIRPAFVVVDCLLTHSLVDKGDISFDPVRIGRVVDIISYYRGETSVLILAPGLSLRQADTLAKVDPELNFSLRATKHEREEEL